MNPVKNYFKYRKTNISPFASLSDCKIDSHVCIRPFAKLERTEIGKCTSIGSLSAVYDTKVGKFCSIARESYIGGANHPLDFVSTSGCFYLKSNFTGICYNEQDYKWHKLTVIDNDVWIGVKAIILSGLHISTGAVIGAGSIVTHDIGPYEIWAGNPARLIRKRFDDETINKLISSNWWEKDDKWLFEHGKYFNSPEEFIKNI